MNLEEYTEAFSSAEDPLLAELDRATHLRVVQPKMLSGRVQGTLLRLVTAMIRPRLVLEIGTFTGYSALSIAAGLDHGAELHTVEIDDELEDLARGFFDRSPHGHKIRPHIGSALELAPPLSRELGRPFDLVYIDGDKREYPDYYRMVMDGGMVRSGSIILADNVLWYGKVAEPETIKPGDRMSLGIVEFNRMVVDDPRVENVILPLRDGISLIRVK